MKPEIEEAREILRDSHGYKQYEVIQLDGKAYVYDYDLFSFLDGKEKTKVVKHCIQTLWIPRVRL